MRSIFLILFIVVGIDGFAQKKIDKIIKHHQAISSMEGVFNQEKQMPQLKNTLKSSGNFYIQGDKMRWEQVKPDHHIILTDKEKMQILEQGEVKSYNLSENRKLQFLQEMMESLADGSFLKDKRFEHKLINNSNKIAIKLSPTAGKFKRFLDYIILKFDSDTYDMTNFAIYQKNGGVTDVTLEVHEKNHNIAPEKFKLQ